jgi:hypothetical protein
VKFAGIDTVLVQDDHDILRSGIQGLINHILYQEYLRGGTESILLRISLCKHPLPSTEVN